MIIKKLISTSIILFATTGVLAQSTEENMTTETSNQLEIIDENSVANECISGSVFDAMSDEEVANIEIPLCEELEVMADELAAEAFEQGTVINDESAENSQCVPAVDFDDMTDYERAINELPVCDEAFSEPNLEESTDIFKS